MSHPKLQPSYILCIFLILKMFIMNLLNEPYKTRFLNTCDAFTFEYDSITNKL